MMDSVSLFWPEKIIFRDGWFIHMDGKGNNSVISHQRARQIELNFQSYQAYMDVNRGGFSMEAAYTTRGYQCVDGLYQYVDYKVDKLIDTRIAPMEQVLKIPHRIQGIPITCIAEHAFENETKITQVILPNSLQEIGEAAFAGCTNLYKVLLPFSFRHVRIKPDAFKNTALLSEQNQHLRIKRW